MDEQKSLKKIRSLDQIEDVFIYLAYPLFTTEEMNECFPKMSNSFYINSEQKERFKKKVSNLAKRFKIRKYKKECVGAIDRSWFSSLLSKAKSRGLSADITIEFLNDLMVKQDFKCALSGKDIALSIRKNKNRWKDLNSASLDRIDSRIGYEEDNCQFTIKKINMMKQSFTQEEFIELCMAVADYTRAKQEELLREVPF